MEGQLVSINLFFIAIGCRTNLVTILGGDYFRLVFVYRQTPAIPPKIQQFVAFYIMLGSRVTVLGFFAASLNLGMIYIWIAFLFHCLLMSIFFRPQKEKRKEVTWTDKSFLAVSLIFCQIFIFIPFKTIKSDSSTRIYLYTYSRKTYKTFICKVIFFSNCSLDLWIGKYRTFDLVGYFRTR